MIGTVAVNNNMMDFFSNIVQVEDKKVMFVDNNIYGA